MRSGDVEYHWFIVLYINNKNPSCLSYYTSTVKNSQSWLVMKIWKYLLFISRFKINIVGISFLKYMYFFSSNFSSIRCSLISFMKDSACKSKQSSERNPLWMVCLPIVHFLDATLNPFQELDYANFQDENSAWWIISELELEKRDLKHYKWSRYFISFHVLY